MDAPDLVIPVRFQHGAAVTGLKAIEQAGQGAGDTVAKGMERAGQATRRAAQETKGFGSELAGLAKTQIALQTIRSAAGSMGTEFKRAADYVRETAEKFAELRRLMQQVAALSKQPGSNEFTVEQIRKAGEAKVLPDEWRRSMETLLNYTGVNVGEGPLAKLSTAEGEDAARRAAALAKSKGVPPEQTMTALGSIIQQTKGKTNVEDVMERFSRGFNVGLEGSIPLAQFMPMMSQVLAWGGIKEEEAAAMLNVSAAASKPEEAETTTEGALRALEEMRSKGTGAEFGVINKMSKYEAFKAFGRNIQGRVEQLRKQGKTDEEIDVEIKTQLAEAGVAAEIRERRGLVRGMAEFGIGKKGFEQYEEVAARTTRGYDVREAEAFEQSTEDKANRRRSREETAELMHGAKEQDVLAALQDARTELKATGEFGRHTAANTLAGWVGWGTSLGVGPEQQMVNERAVQNLRQRAMGLGIRGDTQRSFQVERESGAAAAGDVSYRTQQSVNEEIKDLLKRIAEAVEEQTKQRVAALVGGSIAVVMPNPAGRM
jgi:hypothetical protein